MPISYFYDEPASAGGGSEPVSGIARLLCDPRILELVRLYVRLATREEQQAVMTLARCLASRE